MAADLDPARRRAADRLGWILGLGALGVMAAAFIGFVAFGLPKDPELVRRQQQSAVPVPTASPDPSPR